MPVHDDNLIWIDLEMTGLDTNNDHIIEIATIITDSKLNILAEGPDIVIYQPDDVLALMDSWNQKQHGESGLLQRVKQSNKTVEQAETETLDFIKQYVAPNKSPMCGNTICQDRRFMHRLMPTLEAYFHYRHLDVSTVKELARRWQPELLNNFVKESQHLALEDIRDSIAELQYYQQHFFKL